MSRRSSTILLSKTSNFDEEKDQKQIEFDLTEDANIEIRPKRKTVFVSNSSIN